MNGADFWGGKDTVKTIAMHRMAGSETAIKYRVYQHDQQYYSCRPWGLFFRYVHPGGLFPVQ